MRSGGVEARFAEFYIKWVAQLEQLQLELAQAAGSGIDDQNDYQLRALVARATAHFKEYYTVKWAAAREDVLAFYSPAWLTPLESAHFWFTGWKPAAAFRLIEWSLGDLTEAQVKAVAGIRARVRAEEGKVESDMERQQVAVAGCKMVELARMRSRVRAGDQSDLGRKAEEMGEVAAGSIMAGVERVMKAGDCVRLKAMKSVLDVLTPKQSVKFLAAIAMVHVRLRKEGLKMMAMNNQSSSGSSSGSGFGWSSNSSTDQT
uniref:DOG1 domain-containing protein n=1 Tax=Kalanchoe fedtschenkoi TaxID=63787 RepID=A0A7N0U2D6_KALFE